MKIFLGAAIVLGALGLAACQTTGGSEQASITESAVPLQGMTGSLAGSYESGNAWALEVSADGSALYSDTGSSTKWKSRVLKDGAEVLVLLPDDYAWEGTRYPDANLRLTFDDAGNCKKMLYRSRVAFQGVKPFPASCSGTLAAAS